MKYFARYDAEGTPIAFGVVDAPSVIGEITEAEYNALVQDAETLNTYVDAVYNGEMALKDVPEEYRARVEAIIAGMEEPADDAADPKVEEALAILRGEVIE